MRGACFDTAASAAIAQALQILEQRFMHEVSDHTAVGVFRKLTLRWTRAGWPVLAASSAAYPFHHVTNDMAAARLFPALASHNASRHLAHQPAMFPITAPANSTISIPSSNTSGWHLVMQSGMPSTTDTPNATSAICPISNTSRVSPSRLLVAPSEHRQLHHLPAPFDGLAVNATSHKSGPSTEIIRADQELLLVLHILQGTAAACQASLQLASWLVAGILGSISSLINELGAMASTLLLAKFCYEVSLQPSFQYH